MKINRVAAVALAFGCALAAQASAQEEEDNQARLRWEWFYQQRAFPFQRVPGGALERARTQMSFMRSLQSSVPPMIAGSRWQPIGPRAIPASGISTGRISTIAVHPTNPNIIYVGGAQGGVWRSTDSGANWTPLTDYECSLAMGSLAIDPANPSIVYAATGEQHFSGDSYYGCGVLRSTDGGNNWTRLGASVFVRSRIARLLIVPSTAGSTASTRLLLAADSGIYRSVDGGANWTRQRTGTFTDVVLDPTNENIVYAAARRVGVFRSSDGGVTWEQLNLSAPAANVGRINLAISPTAPRTLYAAIENFSGGALLGIWKTTDAGATWTQLPSTGLSCGTQCWYDMTIAVHPTDENMVYFGGLSLYRSVNGGLNFTNIGIGIHVDQHYLLFDPQNPQRLYVANDGGIYRSNDAGTTWASLNSGLALTQFYSGISLHPSEFAIVLGGTQDNGTLRYNNSTTWAPVIGGDGGFTAINYDNPLIQFGETQWTANSTSGGPRRSDGGAFVRKVSGINTAESALFIPPLVMDPTDSRVLYFGTVRLYRTDNSAESWAAISPVFATNARVSAIAPATADPATIYIATNTGQVHVTSNTGAVWELRTSGLPTRSVTDLAVDPRDPLTAVVTFSGFGTPHIYRTTNAGVSWSNISGNLPDMPVNSILLDPASRGLLLAGSDLGVFMSADTGRTWTILDDGMPNVAVFDLAYNSATASLVAATHGRGMFQLQLNRPLTVAVVPHRRKVLVTDRTPSTPDSAAILVTGNGSSGAAWTVTHRSSASWLTFAAASGAGSTRLRWARNPAGLSPGTYVDTIRIAVAGAVDSPAMLIDSMIVESSVAVLSVDPTVRRDTMSAGASAARADSAAVLLPGNAGAQASWSAAARKASWVTMTTAAGVGPGMVRWRRSAANLNIGIYVDTIVVSAPGAVGSPINIIDSLVVVPVLALAQATRRDSLVSGSTAPLLTTRALTIVGDPAGATSWTVTHGSAAWLTLNTTSGRGNGNITWTRSAANLPDGIYVDTITIAAGAARTTVVDTLVVTAPAVTRACVVDHLFGKACLDATQSRWLDLIGNKDGVYNLGDLVAYFERTPGTLRPTTRRRQP